MTEGLTLGQVLWLITDICIVVFIFLAAVAAIIYWIMGATDDRRKVKMYKNFNTENAASADEMLNKYYQEKEEHGKTIAFYTGALERKDKKIESLIAMDSKRIKRIAQLEKQLRENGIEPVEWDFAA
jgi:uncharacterized membrane protein YhiD involved in acid resistance